MSEENKKVKLGFRKSRETTVVGDASTEEVVNVKAEIKTEKVYQKNNLSNSRKRGR